jgi:hypothetical protein
MTSLFMLQLLVTVSCPLGNPHTWFALIFHYLFIMGTFHYHKTNLLRHNFKTYFSKAFSGHKLSKSAYEKELMVFGHSTFVALLDGGGDL